MDYHKSIKITDPQLALIKAQHYCVYQERCQQEVRDKLYDWGLDTQTVESIICELITTNFLNEQRFAIAFAGGKFRIKKWGRVKIKLELKKRKLTDNCIREALRQISEEDYLNTLKFVINNAKKTINKSHRKSLIVNYKVVRYAVSRGFEETLVWPMLNNEDEL